MCQTPEQSGGVIEKFRLSELRINSPVGEIKVAVDNLKVFVLKSHV